MCFNILNNCKCYTYIIDFFSKVLILDSIYLSPLQCMNTCILALCQVKCQIFLLRYSSVQMMNLFLHCNKKIMFCVFVLVFYNTNTVVKYYREDHFDIKHTSGICKLHNKYNMQWYQNVPNTQLKLSKVHWNFWNVLRNIKFSYIKTCANSALYWRKEFSFICYFCCCCFYFLKMISHWIWW